MKMAGDAELLVQITSEVLYKLLHEIETLGLNLLESAHYLTHFVSVTLRPRKNLETCYECS